MKNRVAPYKIKDLLTNWRQEILNHKRHCSILIVSTVVFTFLYLPIVLQIYFTVNEFEDMRQGAMWSSPWRILIPWLPWVNPDMGEPTWLKGLINDVPEGLGAGSPGYFLLLAALSGIFFTSRKAALVPFILMFIWIFTNHPYKGFSLTILPWFKFARVGSRFTILMPLLLTIMALEIPLRKLKKSYLIAAVCTLLAVIGGLEFYTFLNRHCYRAPEVPKTFYKFMQTVRDSPGEAVLDWPLCIAGGNGVGTDLLGRFFHRNNAVGFMQRYHGKKIVGNYFGRLHMTLIKPFLKARWNKMFHPDNLSYRKSKRQAIPMTDQEWDFFDKFYTLNDFCGISLYPDLLAPGDREKFYERFGRPEISATVSGGLESVFIPKDKERRSMVNKVEGKKIIYWPSIEPGNIIDLVKPELPPEISAHGMFSLVKSEIGLARLAGDGTELLFKSEDMVSAKLYITCYIISATTLIINNRPYVFERSQRGLVRFDVQKGFNRIKFISDEKNKHTIALKELKIRI